MAKITEFWVRELLRYPPNTEVQFISNAICFVAPDGTTARAITPDEESDRYPDFQMRMRVPGPDEEITENIANRLRWLAEALEDCGPIVVGDMGGIYHAETPMRLGYWTLGME